MGGKSCWVWSNVCWSALVDVDELELILRPLPVLSWELLLTVMATAVWEPFKLAVPSITRLVRFISPFIRTDSGPFILTVSEFGGLESAPMGCSRRLGSKTRELGDECLEEVSSVCACPLTCACGWECECECEAVRLVVEVGVTWTVRPRERL